MTRQTAEFEFYEKVRVQTAEPSLAKISGQLAAILGKSVDDDGSVVGYAVHVYATGACWSVKGNDLCATGEFDKRETFYSGESIRVNVRGEIVE
ncbi:MAG: immunity protein 31 [Rhodocyclaceae bacterium]|nr:immunity protein 31 [Rhodocyclaceae bacterium]